MSKTSDKQWLRGIPAAIFNLVNSTVGAGILGLPRVLAISGMAMGLILLAVFALLANWSLRLLHQVALVSRQTTYEDVALAVWNKWLALAVKLAVICINFGALISYMMVCGDFLVPVMTEAFGPLSFFADRKFLIGMVTLLGLLPLSLIKNISSLQWGSAVSILFSVGFVVIVIVRCFVPAFNEGHLILFNWRLQIFEGIGIVIFAFSCHTNLIPVAVEMLENNTRENVATAVYASSAVSLITYAGSALFGYLSFYQNTDGNILNNYDANDTLVTVMRVVLTFSIIFTYPLAMYPCRLSLDRLLFPHLMPFGLGHLIDRDLDNDQQSESDTAVRSSNNAQDYQYEHHLSTESVPLLDSHPVEPPRINTEARQEEQENNLDESFSAQMHSQEIIMIGYVPVFKSTIRFVIETLCLTALAFVLAILLPSVDIVFALVGSIGSACTSYIFPSILWFKARKLMPGQNDLSHRFNVYATPVLCCAGICFGVLGTTMTILSLVQSS